MAIEPAHSHTRVVNGDPPLARALRKRIARRGWSVRAAGDSVMAHRPEWPTQVCVLVRAAEEETPAMLGLAVEFSSMPLRGERFRDVFNSDREELLRSYGNFRLLQRSGDGSWMRPLSHRSFLQGIADGISRNTHVAVFDRNSDDSGDLAEAFATDSNRFVETGSPIAAMLQRLYQGTALSVPVAGMDLPDVVRPSIGMLPLTEDSSGSPYPLRR